MIIFSSYGTVFYKVVKGELPWKFALPFVLNLIFNFAFTPLQFGLKNNILALIDVILVWITLVWVMISVWPEIRWVTYANIPYLLWVSFASILQATITFLNR
jgi:tryptophan-rich sensory protein